MVKSFIRKSVGINTLLQPASHWHFHVFLFSQPFPAFPSGVKQKKCPCLISNYQSDLRYSRVIMSQQVFVIWQLNFLCSLCRSYCIFWDDGWRFPMGSSGWPDRPSAVSSHLSLYQQYLLLLLLLCPGLQHLSVLPPPFGCWVIKIIIIIILLFFLPVAFICCCCCFF